MRSPVIAWPLSAMLLMLLVACASSPPAPAPVQQPDAPAEMMTPAPPQGYFMTTIETILSRSHAKPTP